MKTARDLYIESTSSYSDRLKDIELIRAWMSPTNFPGVDEVTKIELQDGWKFVMFQWSSKKSSDTLFYAFMEKDGKWNRYFSFRYGPSPVEWRKDTTFDDIYDKFSFEFKRYNNWADEYLYDKKLTEKVDYTDRDFKKVNKIKIGSLHESKADMIKSSDMINHMDPSLSNILYITIGDNEYSVKNIAEHIIAGFKAHVDNTVIPIADNVTISVDKQTLKEMMVDPFAKEYKAMLGDEEVSFKISGKSSSTNESLIVEKGDGGNPASTALITVAGGLLGGPVGLAIGLGLSLYMHPDMLGGILGSAGGKIGGGIAGFFGSLFGGGSDKKSKKDKDDETSTNDPKEPKGGEGETNQEPAKSGDPSEIATHIANTPGNEKAVAFDKLMVIAAAQAETAGGETKEAYQKFVATVVDENGNVKAEELEKSLKAIESDDKDNAIYKIITDANISSTEDITTAVGSVTDEDIKRNKALCVETIKLEKLTAEQTEREKKIEDLNKQLEATSDENAKKTIEDSLKSEKDALDSCKKNIETQKAVVEKASKDFHSNVNNNVKKKYEVKKDPKATNDPNEPKKDPDPNDPGDEEDTEDDKKGEKVTNGEDENIEHFSSNGGKSISFANPAKVYHRRKKKNGNGMTKSYYDDNGNGISAEEFQDRMKKFKEHIAAQKAKGEKNESKRSDIVRLRTLKEMRG